MIKTFLKNRRVYMIILSMKNGFVMIEKFGKFGGQYIKDKKGENKYERKMENN